MPVLIAVGLFICIFLLVFFVYRQMTTPSTVVKDRIDRYVEMQQTQQPGVSQYLSSSTQEPTGWRGLIREFSRYFELSQWSRSAELKLIQAGLPLRGSEYVVICLGSIIFAAILLFVLSGGRLVGASMGALVGILIPRMIVNKKAANRAKAFNFQLCDALTLVANSLRTGYSFLQSIEMVAKEMPAPVSVEFSRVRREMNLGLTTEDAMNNLARRVDSADLDLVVTAVLIQRQVGGNLAEILDNIGSTVRERIKMKREVNALTAQGRMSGFIIGSLPIGLGVFIYFVNPKYMEILFSSPFGQMMLVGAFCGQVVGIILIRKIVNIDI